MFYKFVQNIIESLLFYSFLNQTDGEMYKLYQSRVADLVEAKKRAEADGHLMTFDKGNVIH